MKKIISAALAASLTMAAAGVFPVSAAESAPSIVVLGDSIAAGYGLSSSEKNYGQILGDYYGDASKVSNFAVSGSTSQEWAEKLDSPSAELSSALTDADVVVISVGGNDIINYAAKYMLDFAASSGLLADGYSADTIPEKPSLSEMKDMLDTEKIGAYIADTRNVLVWGRTTARLTGAIRITDNDKYDCLIQTQVIPNIDKIVKDIRGINPDLDIVVQNVYNPFQLQPSYLSGLSSNRNKLMGQLSSIAKDILSPAADSGAAKSFYTQLKEFADANDVLYADVYTDFTSEDADKNQYGWYFTNIQKPDNEMDVHPNQRGHLAIASVLAKTLGDLTYRGSLMTTLFESDPDNAAYPAVAKQTYTDVTAVREIPFMLGDVDQDGVIDSADSSVILTDYSITQTNQPSQLTEEQKKAGDVDSDGVLDSTDSSSILSYYAYCHTGGKDDFPTFLEANKESQNGSN